MTESGPLVTIVTPSYNQAHFLEQTMQSVFNQTYPRVEYIVTDAGSKDDSVNIIKKYEHRLKYWHSHRDKGSADGIHQGYQQSTGEILTWLNSDDVLAEDAVEQAVSALLRNPDAVMVYGNRMVIDEKGRVLYLRPSLPVLSRSPYISTILPQETCFFRRHIYDETGGLDADMWFGFDYDLFSKIARRGRIAYARDIWGFFRKHRAARSMLQTATIGAQDAAVVHQRVWGRKIGAVEWKLAHALVKSYAIAAAPFVRKPPWPRCLPPMQKVGVVRAYMEALHETSKLKRVLRLFIC